MRDDSNEKTDPSNRDESISVGTDWSFTGKNVRKQISLAFGGDWRSYSAEYSDHIARRLDSAIERSEPFRNVADENTADTSDHLYNERSVYNTRTLKSYHRWLRTVPVLLGTAGLIVGVMITSTGDFERPLGLFSISQQSDSAAQLYITARGERSKTIVLPDGSTVVMNADSRIRVHNSFGKNDRRVMLEGEAFFSVGAAANKPFIVHTAASTTKVLGTEFNVRSYGNDGKVEVAVLEGRVLLENTVLTAGEVGSIETMNANVVAVVQDLSRYTEWMKGNIIFDDTPFTEVAVQLERHFDVDIRIESPELTQQRVSGTLRSPSLSDALDYLSLMLNAEFRRNGKTITFHKR